MLGIEVAIGLGYEKIIITGCPLMDQKYIQFQEGWRKRFIIIKDKVRSMSGWTRDLLGAPTEEWLDG